MSINTPKNGPETTGADLETAIQNAQSASDLEIEITLPDGSKNPCNVGEAVRTLRAKEVITQDQCSDYHEQIIKKCTELGLNPNDYLGDMKVDEIESLEKMAINIEKGEIEIPSSPDTDAPEIEFEASDSGELREVESGNIDISEPDNELETPEEVSVYNQRLETIAEAKTAQDFYVYTGYGIAAENGTHMFTAIKVNFQEEDISEKEARDLEEKCKEKMKKLRLKKAMKEAISDSENDAFIEQHRGYMVQKTPFQIAKDNITEVYYGELNATHLRKTADDFRLNEEEKIELYRLWVITFVKGQDITTIDGILSLAYSAEHIKTNLKAIINLIPEISDTKKDKMFNSIVDLHEPSSEGFPEQHQQHLPPHEEPQQQPENQAPSNEDMSQERNIRDQANENVENSETPTPKSTRKNVRALLLALAVIGAGAYGVYKYNTSTPYKDTSAATASAQAGKNNANNNSTAGNENNKEEAIAAAADATVENDADVIEDEGVLAEDEDAAVEDKDAIVENNEEASTEKDAELAVVTGSDTGETSDTGDTEVTDEDKEDIVDEDSEDTVVPPTLEDRKIAKAIKIPFLKDESIEIDVETKVSEYGDTLVDFEKSVEKWENNGWEVLEPFHHSYSKWGYILKKDDTIVFVLNQLLEIDQSTIPGWVQPKTW